MRRSPADRQRRRALADTSVTATTPVTEPGPVLLDPIPPPRLPEIQDQAVTEQPTSEAAG